MVRFWPLAYGLGKREDEDLPFIAPSWPKFSFGEPLGEQSYQLRASHPLRFLKLDVLRPCSACFTSCLAIPILSKTSQAMMNLHLEGDSFSLQ